MSYILGCSVKKNLRVIFVSCQILKVVPQLFHHSPSLLYYKIKKKKKKKKKTMKMVIKKFTLMKLELITSGT